MKNYYSLLFFIYLFIYLLLFFAPKIKESRIMLLMALYCAIAYVSSSYFHGFGLEIIGFIFTLGLLFAFFLKYSPFRISFLFCLFLIAIRTMGFPPNGDFGEKHLSLVGASGSLIVSLLWGLFLVHHSKRYQHFLLVLFCFLSFSFFFIFLSDKYRTIPFLQSGLIGIIVLWGFYLIYRSPKEKGFLFALFSCFIFLSILFFQKPFAQLSLFLHFFLGAIVLPLSYVFFDYGEYILLALLLLDFMIQQRKKSLYLQ